MKSPGITALAVAALALFLVAAVAGENFVDPDAFHLMALFREALRLGWVPIRDGFAYTPTVFPAVQHEWGTGALLYVATSTLGASGILAWKYALALGIAAALTVLHRRAATPIAVVAPLAPIGILLLATGFSTVRAQVFTLLGIAILLIVLERDRRGERDWILPWLGVHLVWLNLHAGFVVGSIFFASHVIEQRLRRAPVRHLLATLGAMVALVIVNPYGWRFFPALARGLTLDRSIVTEWDPIWNDAPGVVAVFAGSMLLLAYAFGRRGWKDTPGVLLAVASAAAAFLHQRHVSIYAVVWLGLAPAWIAATPIGLALAEVGRAKSKVVIAVGAALAIASAWVATAREPWRLRVPANPGEHESLLYPSGAVRYLEENRFEGNLMVPFSVGAFVSWKLYPRVLVSFDGRFEVAYPPKAAEENRDFYAARGSWRATLARDPTDAVLAPRGSPVVAALASGNVWRTCYRDDAYVMFVRPGLELPEIDRRGAVVRAEFP
jgi:hypothetical protein